MPDLKEDERYLCHEVTTFGITAVYGKQTPHEGDIEIIRRDAYDHSPLPLTMGQVLDKSGWYLFSGFMATRETQTINLTDAVIVDIGERLEDFVKNRVGEKMDAELAALMYKNIRVPYAAFVTAGHHYNILRSGGTSKVFKGQSLVPLQNVSRYHTPHVFHRIRWNEPTNIPLGVHDLHKRSKSPYTKWALRELTRRWACHGFYPHRIELIAWPKGVY